MSSYVALARKWRPAQFSDIIGQDPIVKTLTNAIRAERLHHAYLFTGCRGIGKTSMARIFAKIIRCENSVHQDQLLHSCDQCSNCLEITSGNSVDVMEIDGASNNGVEAVREIRESAKYMPSQGSKKIYIIDEVHMLSTAAFNALLKTLEEPPHHVIFIFATTEPHKIPATILSRCQRFDYRRVTITQIQERLAHIAQAEHVEAEPAALGLIARAADGSMRDALSLLDQVIAFCGSHLSTQATRECIGLIEGQTLIGILSAVFQRKPLDAIHLVEKCFEQGHDLRVLTRSLIEFLHATLLARVGSTSPASFDLSPEEWEEIQQIAKLRSLEEMELFFQVLHQGMEWIARSPQPKIVLNVLLIKCATADSLFQVSSPDSSRVNHEQSSSLTSAVNPIVRKPLPVGSAQLRTATATTTASINTISVSNQNTAQNLTSAISPSSSQDRSNSPNAAENPSQEFRTEAPNNCEIPSADLNQPTHPTPSSHSPHPTEKSWENFIHHVRKSRPLLASILEHSHCILEKSPSDPQQVSNLVIHFPPQDAYFREQLLSKVYQEQLGHFSKDFFGNLVRFQVELRDSGESIAAKKEREQKERLDNIRNKAKTHPIILEAKSLFGGELGPIDVRENNHHANIPT